MFFPSTVTQDLEERARMMKLKMKLQQEGNMPHHRLDYERDHHNSRSRSSDYMDRHDRSMSRDRIERGFDRGREFDRIHRSRRNKGNILKSFSSCIIFDNV